MLPRIISSIGLVLLVLSVVVVSGCTSEDALDNVYKTESDGLKHYEGEGISFNSLNNWTYYELENNESDYLFSIAGDPVKIWTLSTSTLANIRDPVRTH